MKKTIPLIILLAVFFTFSCSDIEVLTTPEIRLGATPESTSIVSVIAQGTTVTVKYNVTTGAKYSVQIYKFAEIEPAKTLPFTAEEEIVTQVYNLTDLKDGLYDLTLTDINGVSIKKPLIIKR
jgi:hypothetical protein